MPLRPVVAALALVSSLALAACGSDGGGKTEEENATPAMKEGDPKAAENAVSEGYLQHFEKVEGPLEKVDAELNEKLEDGIRENLRAKIRDGGSVAEVTRMISAIKGDLATAEQKLQ
jgi:hypothetical protein